MKRGLIICVSSWRRVSGRAEGSDWDFEMRDLAVSLAWRRVLVVLFEGRRVSIGRERMSVMMS